MPYTLTRETSAATKLYNQEPISTIDPYKNGENAYIYSKTTTTAKTRCCIKNIASAGLLTVCTCRLWPIVHPGLGVPLAKFGHLFFVRRHLNYTWLLQGK
jgi:hypothetical protein